jgi:PKD domain
LNPLSLYFYYSAQILFWILCVNIINSAQGQIQTFPLPTISKLPTVKINFPHNGDNVTVQEPVYVTGVSSDDELTNCQVSIITNNLKPYHDVNATGKSGVKDYSTWSFTEGPELKLGSNKITSKIACVENAMNSTKWYSINVTGVNRPDGNNKINAYVNNSNDNHSRQIISGEREILPQQQGMTSNNFTLTQKQTVSPSSTSRPPVADAGADQTVKDNSVVTLDGTKSKDAYGNITSYSWVQLAGGADVKLSNAYSSIAKLKIPNLKEDELLKFKLTVVDNNNLSSSDITNILVKPTFQSNSKDVPCERIGITNDC